MGHSVPPDILGLLTSYRALLTKHNIRIEKYILFGSYAKNLWRPSSDIDLCIVSPDCTDEHDFQVKLGILTYPDHTKIEPHPFSPEDFKNNATPLIEEIKKYGIRI